MAPNRVPKSSIRRVLKEDNLKKWQSKKRIPITHENAKTGLDFARKWVILFSGLRSLRLKSAFLKICKGNAGVKVLTYALRPCYGYDLSR